MIATSVAYEFRRRPPIHCSCSHRHTSMVLSKDESGNMPQNHWYMLCTRFCTKMHVPMCIFSRAYMHIVASTCIWAQLEFAIRDRHMHPLYARLLSTRICTCIKLPLNNAYHSGAIQISDEWPQNDKWPTLTDIWCFLTLCQKIGHKQTNFNDLSMTLITIIMRFCSSLHVYLP